MTYQTVTYALTDTQLQHYKQTKQLLSFDHNVINTNQSRISIKDRLKAARRKNAVAIVIVDHNNEQIASHNIIQ